MKSNEAHELMSHYLLTLDDVWRYYKRCQVVRHMTYEHMRHMTDDNIRMYLFLKLLMLCIRVEICKQKINIINEVSNVTTMLNITLHRNMIIAGIFMASQCM